MPDALDFQIINALQIHPRVSWTQLGKILAVDSSTISRRWNTLLSERLAWASCYDSGTLGTAGAVFALVEVRCVSGRRGEVIEELVRQPAVFSVNCTSGSRDLYLMLVASTLVETDRYVDAHISSIPGIIGTRTHYLRTIYRESSSWRLNVLKPGQVDALEKLRPSAKNVEHKPAYDAIIAALRGDPRRTAAQVQAEVGRSISVISRDIDAILAAKWVRWHVDFAQQIMGWPAAAVLWLDVNRADHERVVASLKMLNQVRVCASVTGQANLYVLLWLRDLEELDDLEHRFTSAFPRVQIKDRWIIPRIAKRQGHILDDDSRHQQFVRLTSQTGGLED
ncbi:Lrp/AsnC family transcriptional regulator [Arthrobacter sp. NPDC058127]|uniref:Lrp/AsnC family transcriptional regulator n=1 Tax=Arthrobacter sp. NPDC058127 TaxID=3346351 RepID=UPI0036E9201E